MMKFHIYKTEKDIPEQFHWQIRTFLRIIWCEPNDEELDSELTPAELHPMFFILAKGDKLISYARLIWLNVVHSAQTFKLYGLGDVFTFPESRRKGYGKQIVQIATDYIRNDPEADAAVLLTELSLDSFYQDCGWQYLPNTLVTTGMAGSPILSEDFIMILFVSEKSLKYRIELQTSPLFLPGNEW